MCDIRKGAAAQAADLRRTQARSHRAPAKTPAQQLRLLAVDGRTPSIELTRPRVSERCSDGHELWRPDVRLFQRRVAIKTRCLRSHNWAFLALQVRPHEAYHLAGLAFLGRWSWWIAAGRSRFGFMFQIGVSHHKRVGGLMDVQCCEVQPVGGQLRSQMAVAACDRIGPLDRQHSDQEQDHGAMPQL